MNSPSDRSGAALPDAPGRPLLALDHLVIAARTLEEGVSWCEASFGIRPEAGGRHAFMGTHNRVFPIHSACFPAAYAEVIAIDPDAAAPGQARWFDLDDAALQRALADGPRLVHWVARCVGIDAGTRALADAGVDVGLVRQAERQTPTGLLRWRIALRADGGRALEGAAPALIEWGAVHPTDSLPPSGVTLRSLQLGDAPPVLRAMLPAGVGVDARPAARSDSRPEAGHASRPAPPLRALLDGPRGPVTLESPPR